MPEGGLADLGAVAAVDGEAAAALLDDLHRAPGRPGLAAQDVGEAGRVRGPDGNPGAQPGPGEVGRLLVGHEAARGDADHPVGAAGGFLGVVGGEEHGPAEVGVPAQQPVQPVPLPRGEPGGGLVEEQGAGIGQQGCGEPDPAVHAERERAEPLVAQARDADDVEHLVRPGGRDPGGGAEHPQLTADRARGVSRHVAEQDADLAPRMRDPVQGATAEVGDAAARFEFEHEPQRGGLARTGRAQEGGHLPGAGLEGEVVHHGGEVSTGCTGESDGLEHRFSRGG